MKRALVLLAACGSPTGSSSDARQGADATAPADATATRCDPSAAFGAPVAVVALDTASNDRDARLSPDELTVYFASDRPGGAGDVDLYVATRATRDDDFGAPVALAGVDTAAEESIPTVTGDGLTLYAHRHLGTNTIVILTATRSDAASDFGALATVPAIDVTSANFDPYVLADHSALYFDSTRNSGTQFLRAAHDAAGFASPVQVGGGDGHLDRTPVVSRDERTLFFATDGFGQVGTLQLAIATRASTADLFGAPALLGVAGQEPSWISDDGCVLYLVGTSPQGDQDIFVATRGAG